MRTFHLGRLNDVLALAQDLRESMEMRLTSCNEFVSPGVEPDVSSVRIHVSLNGEDGLGGWKAKVVHPYRAR